MAAATLMRPTACTKQMHLCRSREKQTNSPRHSWAMRSIHPGMHNVHRWLWIPRLRQTAHPRCAMHIGGMTMTGNRPDNSDADVAPSLRAQRSNPASSHERNGKPRVFVGHVVQNVTTHYCYSLRAGYRRTCPRHSQFLRAARRISFSHPSSAPALGPLLPIGYSPSNCSSGRLPSSNRTKSHSPARARDLGRTRPTFRERSRVLVSGRSGVPRSRSPREASRLLRTTCRQRGSGVWST